MSISENGDDDPAAVYFKRNVKKVHDKVAALRNALDMFLKGVTHTGDGDGQPQANDDKSSDQGVT